jgi:hypothetical protein
VLESDGSERVRHRASSVQTHGSSISEMNCIRVFDAPPLIHPVNSVARGARGARQVSMVKSFRGYGTRESYA